MRGIESGTARNNFAEIINRAAYGKERVVVKRRGKEIAAVVSLDDLRLLEEFEDFLDAEDARAAEAKAKAKGEVPVPWEKVKKRLGL